MSADNIIYIKKIMDLWWVWEQSASVDTYDFEEIKNSFYSKSFKDELKAYRHALERNYGGYVEYGVNLIWNIKYNTGNN